jgi:preprotein translocase subunit SecG
MLHSILMVIHFFAAAGIIGLVLLQRGKGAEAGAGFGAGASGTVFGARGAGTALSRATAILAAVFMITSLSLTFFSSRKVSAPTSVLEQAGSTLPNTTSAPSGNGLATPAPAAPAPGTVVPTAPVTPAQ